MMKKEYAEELDKILSLGCGSKESRVSIDNYIFNPPTLGEQLEHDGNGRWLGGNEFLIYPKGCDFLKMGGYIGVWKEEQKKEKQSDQEADLVRRQIGALKREPYLITWGVIATLATLVLTLMLLLKSQ